MEQQPLVVWGPIRVRAHYHARVVQLDPPVGDAVQVIAVVDLNDDPSVPSVTNDAESVVGELADVFGLERRRVVYRDSEGRWDELEHDGRAFMGFSPIGTLTLESTIDWLRVLDHVMR